MAEKKVKIPATEPCSPFSVALRIVEFTKGYIGAKNNPTRGKRIQLKELLKAN